MNDDMINSGLEEISNIGTGNAITALSKLLEIPVDQLVPTSTITSFATLHKFVNDYEKEYICGISDISGDVDGMIAVVFNRDSYKGILDVYKNTLEHKESIKNKSDNEIFGYICDTLMDNYLKSINKFLNVELKMSDVFRLEESLLNILSIPASKFVEFDENLAITYSTFKFKENNIEEGVEGTIIYIPGTEAIKKVMQKLMVI